MNPSNFGFSVLNRLPFLHLLTLNTLPFFFSLLKSLIFFQGRHQKIHHFFAFFLLHTLSFLLIISLSPLFFIPFSSLLSPPLFFFLLSSFTFKRLSPSSIFIFSFSFFITVFFNNFFAFLYFFSSSVVIPSNSIPVCSILSSALLFSHSSYFLFLFVLSIPFIRFLYLSLFSFFPAYVDFLSLPRFFPSSFTLLMFLSQLLFIFLSLSISLSLSLSLFFHFSFLFLHTFTSFRFFDINLFYSFFHHILCFFFFPFMLIS
ncbi:unnamed protein product [Acanthosepion pharaonis]|uniref:Uncharacterized protein n=1 Tax=Acanthosepion pharaonis TaxID=158019 RepID=A0A812ETV1_ACAPH|nr:unnamed protein product [Sepia pharaonis]